MADSDMDTTSDVHSDGDDESEYEEIEIEVEEEVEVEEEEEIEEEEETDDDAEEEEEAAKIDTDQGIKPVSMETHVNPGSATLRKLVVNLPSGSQDLKQNEELRVNGEVTPAYHGMTGDIASKSFGNVNTVTSDIGSNKKAKDDPCLERITYQIQIDGEDSRVRPRSSTPESELNDSSKRAAIICEFFAKGWCIKGNSCRFLHVKDEVGVRSHAKREISETTQKKIEPLVKEVNSLVQPTSHCGENQGQKMEDFSSLRHETLELPSLDFRRDLNNYRGNSSPWTKVASCQGTLSNNGSRLSENGENTRINPHIFEEITCKSNNFLPDTRNLPVSLSSLPKSPLSFGYPSWNTAMLGGQDLLANGPQYRASRSASVQRSSSPPSGSEWENLSRANAFVDKQCTVGLHSKIPYNWEPSIPFQPSYPLTKSLLSKLSSRSEYDPIRDSIEDTASGKRNSAIGAPKQGDGDVLVAGALGTECSSNKYSISDSNLHGICSSKSLPGKDICQKDDNIETSGAQWQDRKALLKDTKLVDSDHNIRDAMGDEVSINGDSKLESGEPYRSQSKEDRSRLMMEADADLQVEESRALRNFHASLVEVVKELLRPRWQRGLLSKDVHKIIVKKSVDKVLSTVPANQVPNTAESVKLYLVASQEKLAKLVEGYVEKYRKS